MTLEEVMLFSLVYSLGTFDGINIDETIRQSYIEALNENELFKDLVYKLNNYFSTKNKEINYLKQVKVYGKK